MSRDRTRRLRERGRSRPPPSPPSITPIAFDLPCASIAGEVVFADGLLVPRCTLELRPLDPPDDANGPRLLRATPSVVGGRFALTRLPVGRTRLVAGCMQTQDDGSEVPLRVVSEPLVIVDGVRREGLRLELRGP